MVSVVWSHAFSCVGLAMLLHLAGAAVERDDYQPLNKCLTPASCTSLPSAAQQQGPLLLQLLSGREHSDPATAQGEAQRRLFEQAKAMVNFQYLVGDRDTREALLVDGAWDVEGILRYARGQGVRIVGYVATHFHYDHVGGRREGIPGLAGFVDQHNLTAYVPASERDQILEWTGVRSQSSVVGVAPGTVLRVGGTTVRWLHTPGHSPGGSTLVCGVGEREQLAITGDTLFPGSCGRVDLPGADKRSMYQSLQRVLAALPGELVVWPGHGYSGASSTIETEKRTGLLRPISEAQWTRMMG